MSANHKAHLSQTDFIKTMWLHLNGLFEPVQPNYVTWQIDTLV